jgi:hypothetical protein
MFIFSAFPRNKVKWHTAVSGISSNMSLGKMLLGLFLREEALLDKFLGDLDGVGRGALAEVVGNAPEVEA